jgi:diguanylate cyclase (GGDEF)-like protein
MNIIAITQYASLVERLRMAYEGAGHHVTHLPDPLSALATEAWNEAELMLVDGSGDPLDGFRFCSLMRGESRALFHNLPIYIILKEPPDLADMDRLREVDGDGFVAANSTLHQLLHQLEPVMEGDPDRAGRAVPVCAIGLPLVTSKKLPALLQHFRFELMVHSASKFLKDHETVNAPLVLLGIDASGERALRILNMLREQDERPFIILIGNVTDEALERKLLLAGAGDWLPVPLSGPRLLHACRRGMEWMHGKRVKLEFDRQINDLRERRTMLEIEAASLRNEVLTDPLTQLLNRRAFDQNLEHAIHQWDRHKRPFVLILSDLDHFKLINDRFGHGTGDEVLKALTARIRISLRKSDLAFRIGGEEFAVLLTETNLKVGESVAEKLRRRIDGEPLILEGGHTIFPSMSFGVGGPGAHNAKDLFSQVDKALYQAKSRGRNCVVVVGG